MCHVSHWVDPMGYMAHNRSIQGICYIWPVATYIGPCVFVFSQIHEYCCLCICVVNVSIVEEAGEVVRTGVNAAVLLLLPLASVVSHSLDCWPCDTSLSLLLTRWALYCNLQCRPIERKKDSCWVVFWSASSQITAYSDNIWSSPQCNTVFLREWGGGGGIGAGFMKRT